MNINMCICINRCVYIIVYIYIYICIFKIIHKCNVCNVNIRKI